jgi:hypothetical protein
VSVFKETMDEIVGDGHTSLDNIQKSERGVQTAYTEYSRAVGTHDRQQCHHQFRPLATPSELNPAHPRM